ncbi:BTAD domain-containing putative transcriptional regulator [Nocardioides sp. SYSU D00038]|uniref:AfsR/SARP family transcriptional regulator n=1 Tax=Nocardioides sp. SYSU D00038 TaxID=2812554 RepID=UPI0019680D68|nr:BTAD domain-containing putative transcriptional regulator [Nocardioides sp. SYSU D00038]
MPSADPPTVLRGAVEVRVGVLGPLTLEVDGAPVTVPGPRRRALLALLALAGGRVVGVERLVDALWPETPPDNAVPALYNHVSRLRGHLGAHAGRLERLEHGYRLVLGRDELDSDAVRRLARLVGAPGTPPQQAASYARAALDLWRGTALEEFRALPALEVESVPLDELRLRLVDDLLAARLGAAEPRVAADAAAAVAAQPLRERSALLLVRALAAEGRTPEAMAAAQAYRHRLAEETGLDPGPALAELEQAVASGRLAPAAETLGTQGAGADRTSGSYGTNGRALEARRAVVRPVVRPDGPLVGRERDRAEVLRLVGNHAVVTVTGTGGVGKTRLVLDVAADTAARSTEAEDRPDVVVVDLAAVDRPERLAAAVATALGLRATGRPTDVAVADALGRREVLLVLDNCEHLAAACRDLVTTLRGRAPGVRVLATSRVTLHAPGEYVVRLQPLGVPRDAADPSAVRRQPAVRALVEHARRLRPNFELGEDELADAVEVLRRLDGLPLGIELAARQVAVMPVRAVRARLDRALDLATGLHRPDDDRQRTLRATIDSSYRLLGEEERRLLRSLAPFPGGVDLATVEALAADAGTRADPIDVLHHLVDASLVVADTDMGRYRLLFTVREFLIEQLRATRELAAAEQYFLDRCLAVATDLGAAIVGPDERMADVQVRCELDNLRAARDVAAGSGRDDVRLGLTLALADGLVWRDLRETWDWALELAADPALEEHPLRAAVLGCAAEGARLLGDLDRAEALGRQALAVAGPDADLASTYRAWSALASVAHFRGDFDLARELWLRSGEGRPAIAGSYLASAALATGYGGDPALARELLTRARALVADSGSASQAAFTSYVEGELIAPERPADAIPLYVRAIESARGAGSTFVEGVASVALASARARAGDVAGAAAGFDELIGLWRRTGQGTQLWTTARNAAGLLAGVGRPDVAALLLVCADAAPGAAAVGPRIARFSGRSFTVVSDLVDDAVLARVREEAARLGPDGVLDLAVAELRVLAGG